MPLPVRLFHVVFLVGGLAPRLMLLWVKVLCCEINCRGGTFRGPDRQSLRINSSVCEWVYADDLSPALSAVLGSGMG